MGILNISALYSEIIYSIFQNYFNVNFKIDSNKPDVVIQTNNFFFVDLWPEFIEYLNYCNVTSVITFLKCAM